MWVTHLCYTRFGCRPSFSALANTSGSLLDGFSGTLQVGNYQLVTAKLESREHTLTTNASTAEQDTTRRQRRLQHQNVPR
jgi:hypothetical protein